MTILAYETSTNQDLIKALEENQFSFFRALRDWSRVKVHENNNLRWLESDIPFPPLNGVWHTQLEPKHVKSTILPLIERAKSLNLPMLWWVGPTSQPSDLGIQLEDYDFTNIEQVPGMAINLDTLDEQFSTPEDITIQRINDLDLLKAWGEIFVKGGELPEFMLQPASERLRYANPDIVYTYMGWLDGTPVATSQMVLANGVAGLYNIGTLPEARRRGIGAKMTLLPLVFARSQGYKIGVLTASDMGIGMYRSLGFKEICKINLYLWSPPD